MDRAVPGTRPIEYRSLGLPPTQFLLQVAASTIAQEVGKIGWRAHRYRLGSAGDGQRVSQAKYSDGGGTVALPPV